MRLFGHDECRFKDLFSPLSVSGSASSPILLWCFFLFLGGVVFFFGFWGVGFGRIFLFFVSFNFAVTDRPYVYLLTYVNWN